MKTLLFGFVFAGVTGLAVNAQDVNPKDVPTAVTNAISQKYTNATKIDWEMNESNYEAEFKINRTEHTVLVDPTGRILMTKRDVDKKELPQAINASITQNYKGLKLDDVEILEKGGTTYYQVELNDKASGKQLVFTTDGSAASNITYWD
ncbi:PepSY-like domain-containing protein [Pontibacter populi]|uniref:PepSY-like domain-containing protein n=1 Tax=Pontibacter populi TaxID=890055 RepID=A0ABV1RUK2_9BACT